MDSKKKRKENGEKLFLIHYRNLEKKIGRNQNKEKLGLGKRQSLRKRKQMLFVFLYFMHLYFFTS